MKDEIIKKDESNLSFMVVLKFLTYKLMMHSEIRDIELTPDEIESKLLNLLNKFSIIIDAEKSIMRVKYSCVNFLFKYSV